MKKKPFNFKFLKKVIWAESLAEAFKILGNGPQKPVDRKEEVSTANKSFKDLNQDGKFDKKDATIAGKVLNESKNLKT